MVVVVNDRSVPVFVEKTWMLGLQWLDLLLHKLVDRSIDLLGFLGDAKVHVQ
jgi:hypothetical protein